MMIVLRNYLYLVLLLIPAVESESEIKACISDNVFRIIGRIVSDKVEDYVSNEVFSGSYRGSVYVRYWNMRLRSTSVYPLQITHTRGTPFEISGSTTVSTKVTSSFRAEYETWLYTFHVQGSVTADTRRVRASSAAHVASNGDKVTVTHLPGRTSVSVGSLSLDFSGSWFSWVLDLLGWVFEDRIKGAINTAIKDEINTQVVDFMKDVDSSINQYKTSFKVPNGAVVIESGYESAYGGPGFVMVGYKADVQYYGNVSTTTISPTTSSLTTEQSTQSSSSTNDKRSAKVPSVDESCPSGKNQIQFSEDLIHGIADLAYKMWLTKFELIEFFRATHYSIFVKHIAEEFRGRANIPLERIQNAKPTNITTKSKADGAGNYSLQDFRIDVKAVSRQSGSPRVRISKENGVEVFALYKANVILNKHGTKESLPEEYKIKILVLAEVTAKPRLAQKDKKFTIFPNMEVTSFVGNAKWMNSTPINKIFRNEQYVLDTLEDLVKRVYFKEFTSDITKFMEDGFPFNFPNNFVISNSSFTYQPGTVNLDVDISNIVVN